MLEQMLGRVVVIDLRSPFVCLGKLTRVEDGYLQLEDADMHDLRDTQSTREQYVVDSRRTGVKRNRKHILLTWREVVAVSALEDVVDE